MFVVCSKSFSDLCLTSGPLTPMQNLGATNNEILSFRMFAPCLHIMHVEIKLILYISYIKDQRIWLKDEKPNEHVTK